MDRRAGSLLASLVTALGLAWAAIFAAAGPLNRLYFFGDGSIFSYAVAVQDSWNFHFRNISGRAAVWLFTLLPGEALVAATGSPTAGTTLYGALHFLLPLLGLLATWIADHTPGRLIFRYACASTAVLCPFVFGFPTEMWLSHAAFWPALALAVSAPSGRAWSAALALAFAVLLTSHEAAVVWTAALLLGLAVTTPRDRLVRAVIATLPGLAVWCALKLAFRPEPYVDEVLGRNGLNLITPANLTAPVLVTAVLALAAYAALFALLTRRSDPAIAATIAASLAAAALALWWLGWDDTLHADNRYYLRTLLFGAVPAAGWLALVHLHPPPWLVRATEPWPRPGTLPRIALGALALITLIHAVETTKFITAWNAYRAAIATLATDPAADPTLGDPAFVSTERLGPRLNRLSWNSTTPYLSILLSENLTPARLVVDPVAGYFWLSCATATANEQAPRAAPRESRRLARIHACLHRPD